MDPVTERRLDDFLDDMVGRLRVPAGRRQEMREELRTHLESAVRQRLVLGRGEGEAIAEAFSDFGDRRRIRRQLAVRQLSLDLRAALGEVPPRELPRWFAESLLGGILFYAVCAASGIPAAGSWPACLVFSLYLGVAVTFLCFWASFSFIRASHATPGCGQPLVSRALHWLGIFGTNATLLGAFVMSLPILLLVLGLDLFHIGSGLSFPLAELLPRLLQKLMVALVVVPTVVALGWEMLRQRTSG